MLPVLVDIFKNIAREVVLPQLILRYDLLVPEQRNPSSALRGLELGVPKVGGKI